MGSTLDPETAAVDPAAAEHSDVGQLADLLADLGKAAEETAANFARDLGGAESVVRDGLEQAEATIRERPLLALGLAAGLGFVLGALLRGRGNSDDE
jgi:ElaB/YqjD/DUF883 family membrane-anchored ribosome-binding protein